MFESPGLGHANGTNTPHLITLILLTAFSTLSLNMFLPSLANIAIDLEAKYATVSLAIAGYRGVTAVIQLVVGPLSVRPGLAGSAAGMNGATVVGSGAVLTSLTGVVLPVEEPAPVLLLLMLMASAAGLMAVLIAMRLSNTRAG